MTGKRIFLLAPVAFLLLPGCGGDRPSKAEYVSRLNAMCADFAAREKRIGEPQTLADVAARGQRIVDAFDASIRNKIARLKAPDELVAEAGRLRKLADEQHDTLQGLVDAADAHDGAKAQRL